MKYPWHLWLNGEPHEIPLWRFPGYRPKTIRTMVWNVARRRGRRVSVGMKWGSEFVRIQAIPQKAD